jgi:uncharacterized protein (TIGR02246 family)
MTDPNTDSALRLLYTDLIGGWNRHSAHAFAAGFAEDGEVVGFDGSQMFGRAQIQATLAQIFADHVTAPYIVIVRVVKSLGPQAALLRAVAGMVPVGVADIEPSLNAIHSLVGVQQGAHWRIALFQNTPAQFHGRPELVQQLTEELRDRLKT